jgi:hypothetical protein
LGSTANDLVGGGLITPLANGDYIIPNLVWDNGGTVNAGAISYGSGSTGTVGVVNANNSVLGNTADGGPNLVFAFDTTNNQLVVGRPFDNVVTLFRPTSAPTAAHVSISGRVTTADGSGVRNVTVTLTDVDGNSRNALTSTFGYYRFEDVPAGATYVITPQSKLYHFSSRVVTVLDDLTEVDFIAGA